MSQTVREGYQIKIDNCKHPLNRRQHDYDLGEEVCLDCGLVVYDQTMDPRPDRAFTLEERAKIDRHGGPLKFSVYNKNLPTEVGYDNRDAFGRKLTQDQRYRAWRNRVWQGRSNVHYSKDRNLKQAMAELDRLADKVYIPPPIKEQAAVIYRKTLDKGLTRGRSIEAITAAALYAACRGSGTPRKLSEIADVSLVDKKDVARCYRLLLRELEIRVPIADPVTLVSKIAEKTGTSGKTQAIAIQILRDARKNRAVAGKDPMGLGAAALYIAGLQNNEKKNQKDLAEAAEVTEVTVRNRYKALKKILHLKLPNG